MHLDRVYVQSAAGGGIGTRSLSRTGTVPAATVVVIARSVQEPPVPEENHKRIGSGCDIQPPDDLHKPGRVILLIYPHQGEISPRDELTKILPALIVHDGVGRAQNGHGGSCE